VKWPKSRNRGSSVTTVNKIQAGRKGFEPRQERDSFVLHSIGPSQSPIQHTLGSLFPGIKQPGRGTVKNTCIYELPPPHHVFIARCLIKHSFNFAFAESLSQRTATIMARTGLSNGKSVCFLRGKGKVQPRTGHEGPEGGKDIPLLFLEPRC
jgi:hypothetical protein